MEDANKTIEIKTLGDEKVSGSLGVTTSRNGVAVNEKQIFLWVADKKGRYNEIAMMSDEQAKELGQWLIQMSER